MDAYEIFLNKKLKVLPLFQPANQDNKTFAASVNKNLESYGYILSEELFYRLSTAPLGEIVQFWKNVKPVVAKLTGAHQTFKPMYANFPDHFMGMSDFEIYMNALVHYWLSTKNVSVVPIYDEKVRPSLNEPCSLKVIEIGYKGEFLNIFRQLIESNSSLSDYDKEIVRWFIKEHLGEVLEMYLTVPQKENLALFVGELLKGNIDVDLSKYLKTPTDVLRVMTAMSGGDVSLAKPVKFINFPKRTRRTFLQCIERSSSDITEEFLKLPQVWKRVGERLHPGDYSHKFPRVFEAFRILRSGSFYRTYNSTLENDILCGDLFGCINALQTRPGIYARRLAQLIRKFPEDGDFIAEDFAKCADKVSTPVLMQVRNYFNQLNTPFRTFFPKGNVGKIVVEENNQTSINPIAALKVVSSIEQTLIDRFGQLPKLGKVYIDIDLVNHPIPFAMRSASKSLRTLSRGARLHLPNKNILRFFLWWKNGKDRVDIDLSCQSLNSKFEQTGFCTYYRLRNDGLVHSGDIVTAPFGACEFIEVDKGKLLKNGTRYVVMLLTSFTKQSYKDLPECFAGWMAREKPMSGAAFEPKTVVDKIDLESDQTSCIPVIFDLVDDKAIWTDLSSGNGQTLSNNFDKLVKVVKGITTLNKPNLYDLFVLHTLARGQLVFNKEEADLVFSLDEGITPFDRDKILSEFYQ